MSDIVVGIDLGTSNSVISVVLEGQPIVIPDETGRGIHPSIVHFFEDGRTLVGNTARPYRIQDPQNTVYSAKRLIGRPYDSPDLRVIIGSFPYPIVPSPDNAPRIQVRGALHPPEGIGARVLYYMKELAQSYLGQEISKAVITVPANFDEGQRRATKKAGEMAGLDVLRMINEPTAAALAYGYGQGRRERVAIYDYGGGTFDITILELRDNVFEVLSTAGNTYLGGDDFDNRIVAAMLRDFEKQYGYDLSSDQLISQRLKAMAEHVKHELSGAEFVTKRIIEYVPGSLTELELEFTMTREAFNRQTEDMVHESLRTCEEALQVAGLSKAEVDHLVLVGGSTRIPLVQERAQQFFGKRAVMGINPDEVVSVGAAIFGASLVQTQAAPPPMAANMNFAQGYNNDDSWMNNLDDDGGPSTQRMAGPPGGMGMPPQQQVAVQSVNAPLLLDVIPHALGIATVGGVMDIIIERNAQIPLERTRYFSTSRDNQTRVVLPIYSGNSRRIEENSQLGVLELQDIPPGPRESVKIEVTFEIDTSGMLNIRATDMRTGRATQARLNVAGVDNSGYNNDYLLQGGGPMPNQGYIP